MRDSLFLLIWQEDGMARGTAVKIELSQDEHEILERWTRRRRIARAEAVRAQIVLLAGDGLRSLYHADFPELGAARYGSLRR